MSEPEGGLELQRLARLQQHLVATDCDALLLYDPLNVRYATGTTNMAVYSLHHPCRYALVPAEGPVTLFEFKTCEHLSEEHPAVGEVRNAVSWYHFITGPRTGEFADRWAAEIASLLGSSPFRRRGTQPRLAVDRLDPLGLWALGRCGVEVTDGGEIVGLARAVKCPGEIAAIRSAVEVCERAIAAMEAACRPGITEQELWSVMHQVPIAGGGEWFETRLLTSGPRTNPWYQECSDRVIREGDLVAFDTDHVGLGGYTVDVSRTWLAGDAKRTPEQRTMYAAACEQVQRNTELLQPGVTFAELSERAYLPPGELHSEANACVAPGMGLCNEYPLVLNRELFGNDGYDGVLEAGMVLCVESLVAPVGWPEAVKLEEQVLITPTGPELLSKSPVCEALLS
ncbi:M24 family metallopeptidase [Candidatus Poriferisodalis sp.]|uniref:M24 family metallopeptidase n=1 Tax=Candidatus Poriferisodalis sp. TaxID=3101277 RepID=UPI003B5C8861